MRNRAAKILAMLIIAALVIVCLPFGLLLHRQTAYYAYKEVVYRAIAEDIAKRAEGRGSIARSAMAYFYEHLYPVTGAAVIDKDVYNDLIRGIAWCDQRAWGMATILGKLGIDNRMLMVVNPNGESGHTVLEARAGGRWGLFDPTFGFEAVDKDGNAASYADVCSDPSLFYSSPAMPALKRIDPTLYGKVMSFTSANVYYKNPRNPAIWSNPLNSKDAKRRAITAVLDLYSKVFGKYFSYPFQEVYLAIYSGISGYDPVYFKARNYDLMGRDESAIKYYTMLVEGNSSYKEKALFFYGVLLSKKGNERFSTGLLKRLLKEYPNSKWTIAAHYYLGRNGILRGDIDSAVEEYRKVVKVYQQCESDPEAMDILKTDVVLRLDHLMKKYDN